MEEMNLAACIAVRVPVGDGGEEISLEFLLPALDDDLSRADIRRLERMPKLSASTEVGDMTVTISIYPDSAERPCDRAHLREIPRPEQVRS